MTEKYNLLIQAKEKYEQEGIRSVSTGALRHIANQIENSEERKRNVIQNYTDTKYLNVGGGKFIRDDWRVLDYYTDWYNYSEMFIDYNINLEDGMKWPIDDNEFSLVFSSHTLEHLSDEAIERRCLKCIGYLNQVGLCG
jgi:hypothetical protein